MVSAQESQAQAILQQARVSVRGPRGGTLGAQGMGLASAAGPGEWSLR